MVNRLKELREKKGLLQKDVAKYLNVSVSTYSFWEKGTYEPDQKSLIKLANFFEVSIDYLLGRTDLDFFIFDSKIIYYPNPADVDHKEPHILSPADPYHFKELFKLKSYHDSNISTLEVSDDSMAPRICKGDLVKIQKQKEYEENNIVAIILDKNEITLRKIKKENNGMWFLSTNPSYPPLFYSNTELNESKVLFLGKVYSLYAEF